MVSIDSTKPSLPDPESLNSSMLTPNVSKEKNYTFGIGEVTHIKDIEDLDGIKDIDGFKDVGDEDIKKLRQVASERFSPKNNLDTYSSLSSSSSSNSNGSLYEVVIENPQDNPVNQLAKPILKHDDKPENFPPPSVERHNAATKIQAGVRGMQVRDKTILPTRVGTFLQTNSKMYQDMNSNQQNDFRIAVAREINTMMVNTADWGTPKKINEWPVGEFIQIPGDARGQHSIDVPVDLYATVSKDGKSITLELRNADDPMLGKGGYKQVFPSQTYVVEMRASEREKSTNQFETARVNMIPSNTTLGAAQDAKRVARGADIQRQCLEAIKQAGYPPGVNITPSLQRLDDVTFTDQRYNGTLKAVLDSPDISNKEKLEMVKSVIQTVAFIHSLEVCHNDIKGVNILCKDNTPYVADFDLATGRGFDELGTGGKYRYWDYCMENAIVTPLADRLALVQLLMSGADFLSWNELELLKGDIFTAIHRGSYSSTELWNIYNTQGYANGSVQHQMFEAFCSICVESIVLLHAINQDPTITKKEDIDAGVINSKLSEVEELLSQQNYEIYDMPKILALADQCIAA